MTDSRFFDELRWCPACNAYVRFMESYQAAYCAHCDTRVMFLRRKDWLALFRRGQVVPRGVPARTPSRTESGARDVAMPDFVDRQQHEAADEPQ